MDNRLLRSPVDLEQMVWDYGFLPFFRNSIPGYSIEEHTPAELWFSDEVEGPWDWKGPIIRNGNCAYGKFFDKKAGFISMEWFPDFATYRRDGYDFDARYDDGLVPYKDKAMYDAISGSGSILSKDLKYACNYSKNGNKGFETVITRLQTQTYVVTADFERRLDKHGLPYGWAVARYATPEELYGEAFTDKLYQRTPMEAKARIERHINKILQDTPESKIKVIFGL